VRRTASAIALLLVAGLVVAGCSSGDPEPGPTTSAPVEVGSDGPFPEVTGAFGEAPELSFPDAEPSDGLQVEVLEAGDGAKAETGDLIAVNYLGQRWGTEEAFDSSYERSEPSVYVLGSTPLITGFTTGLTGLTTGSRAVMTIPPSLGYGDAGNPDIEVSGTDTLVFVVDVVGTWAPDESGQADATPTAEAADVVPVVEGALGGPATITVPSGAAEPTQSTTTVLATGTGAPVAPGTLVVQYAATQWDGSEGQSTWENGLPATVSVGSGGPFDGLLGVPIGSRVLVEIPAAQDQPAIAAVFDVVDQVFTTS
jgi:peptidylprolyl isomerase